MRSYRPLKVIAVLFIIAGFSHIYNSGIHQKEAAKFRAESLTADGTVFKAETGYRQSTRKGVTTQYPFHQFHVRFTMSNGVPMVKTFPVSPELYRLYAVGNSVHSPAIKIRYLFNDAHDSAILADHQPDTATTGSDNRGVFSQGNITIIIGCVAFITLRMMEIRSRATFGL